VGTAYRHFANKEELVDAIFEDMIESVERVEQDAIAAPDAWQGLVSGLERVCELQSFDRGLRQVMLGTGKGPQRQALVEQRLKPLVEAMVARASEQGLLREGIQHWDFPMIQIMIAGITEHTGSPVLWRRYLQLIVDGMRPQPDGSTPLLGGDLSPSEVKAAIRGSGSDLPRGPN
jgi:AcrR family transcriptional regulator